MMDLLIAYQFQTVSSMCAEMVNRAVCNSLDQIAQFQQYWDDTLEGNSAQRRHLKFIPDGMKYMPPRTAWLTSRTCSMSGLPGLCASRSACRQRPSFVRSTGPPRSLPRRPPQKGLVPYDAMGQEPHQLLSVVYMRQPDVEFSWDQEEDIDPLCRLRSTRST